MNRFGESLKNRLFSFKVSNFLLLDPEASLTHVRDAINYQNHRLFSPQRKD